MHALSRFLLVAVVGAVVSGCPTPSVGNRYGKDGELNFGEASTLTASEKLLLAQKASEAIKIDPLFSKNYQAKKRTLAAKKGAGTVPLLSLALFKDNTGAGNDLGMRGLATEFRDQMRKSGLFEVIDDQRSPEMMERLLRGDLGENGAALQNIGDYTAPDYYLSGELRKEKDGDGYLFSLHIEALDTANRKIFWSDTVRLQKKTVR